ncbi:lysophospholipid acyltransferase family protein [Desulfovibrio sp. Huiquan2017]|uniref:lysophospholipid acyltransferase family protein n=1 Tax=Desulfovibrio sp. Huiquan2017 TaxID=2816861 RepID=UPI001A919502|nr:lysophospholipid acyltransferase family protein [Desulfovibrio sp. Huiquan2017]
MKIPIDPAAFAPFIAWLFKLWGWTIRFEPVGNLDFIASNKSGEAKVIALWHGEIFPVTAFGHTATSHLVTFVSQSKDGEVIARVLERLGHTTVRGSSTRGGVKALLQAKRIMEQENRMAVFTVDGPTGPRYKAKDGIIFLAQRAGAKILPLRAYPVRRKIFTKSWDHFVLPFPFTRCPVYIGEPMTVTSEKLTREVLERETARLESRMLALGPK